MLMEQYDMQEVITFLKEQDSAKTITVPADTVVGFEGKKCLNFTLVLEGKIKVYKTSMDGKLITLYYINQNEGCILTTASIINDLPLPAMAQTITECKVITFPAHLLINYFDISQAWRKFVFSLISNKMASLVTMVDDLAFHKLDERLLSWLNRNASNNIIDTTHQEIADQLASTREVISRSLKKLEKSGLISLSRGKIHLLAKIS
jgi:CRP/FNR family transcriptional regulator